MEHLNLSEEYVLGIVRESKVSIRKGAELLGMTYREFLQLMAAHKIPVFDADAEADWWEHEQKAFKGIDRIKKA